MSDSADKADPFYPLEFTARELQLAGQFLQILRLCKTAANIDLAFRLEGERMSLLWQRPTEPLQWFCTDITLNPLSRITTLTYCSAGFSDEGSPRLSDSPSDSPPAQPSQADEMPRPDAVVEPPPDDEPRQP